MHTKRLAALTGAAALALGVGLPASPAEAADTDTLYVNNAASANCSDAGTGTAAQPYCTIQAAADAAQPGQTVKVAHGGYREQVKLTHSGTADKPITFVGGTIRNIASLAVMPPPTTGSRAFTATGVHDIKLTGFRFASAAEAVLLNGTQRMTVEGNYFQGGNVTDLTAAIRVTGGAEDTTLDRNVVNTYGRQTVSIEAGSKRTVVTRNALTQNANQSGITVTDAPGTLISSNSISTACQPGLALVGDSSGAVVENNVLASDSVAAQYAGLCGTSPVRVKVSDASRAGTTIDYNLANPLGSTGVVYDWAGTATNSLTAYGQGAHDLIGDPRFGSAINGLPAGPGSPGIDSGNPAAPGASDTDLYGYHRIDDPYIDGGGVMDRGATEYTTSSQIVVLEPSVRRLPTGEQITVALHPQDGWTPVVSHAVDFGDGTPAAVTTGSPVQHSYAATGSFPLSVTTTYQNGDTYTTSSDTVTVSEPGPLVARAVVTPQDQPLTYQVDTGTSTSPWSIAKHTVDFGDGTVSDSMGAWEWHSYRKEGDYTVTTTVTDAGGRTEHVSQQLHVAYRAGGFTPMTPTRVMDTRNGGYGGRKTLGPGQTLTIPIGTRMGEGLPTLPIGDTPTSVVLNVTAISKDAGGFLTVFPAGTEQPGTSNLNFGAKQTVPNLVTVPVGPDGNVAVFNKYGNTDVVADILGYYSVGHGDRYTAQQSARLADTRAGGGAKVGPGAETTIQVAGRNGVPADASSAVLNVTATDASSASYLTVYPTGTSRPGTSNLNFTAGQTVPNQVVVPLGKDGKVTVYNFGGSTNVVADLFGYYSPSGEALFTPVTPKRLADTRSTTPLGTGATRTFAAATPAGATGAVLNVTATGSDSGGYLTVWAAGATRPGTSNLNFTAGQTVPNHVTTPLGPDQQFNVFNFKGNTDVVADLFGYFSKP